MTRATYPKLVPEPRDHSGISLYSRGLFTKWLLFSNLAFTLFLPTASSAQDRGLFQAPQSPIERALHPPVSTDTHIVDVRFGNTVYAIPRNYLVGVTQPHDENFYAAFTIQVLLPDLAPRTSENATELDRVG